MSCHEPYFPRKRCDDGPVCVQGPQGPPGLPCDLDWGAAVMQYIRTAVVGIATRTGDVLGRGFWVSNTVVATSWSLINRESAGVRVILDVPMPLLGATSFQAVPIDGVVLYAVPLLDVAFVVVNPMLLSNVRYTPRILTLESATRAGDRVATTSAPGSFATGFVCNPSVGTYGYIADVTTSLAPCVSTLVGAPIIHAYTYGIVGMVQYVYAYDVTSGGVNAVLLAAAISWAASSCVLTKRIAQGPVTIPVLRDALALGVLTDTMVPGVQVAVPLVTEAVRPQLLSFPLGETATGAWVYNPFLIVNSTYGTGTDRLTASGNKFTFNTPFYQDSPSFAAAGANYARANSVKSYTDINFPANNLTPITDDGWVKIYPDPGIVDDIIVTVSVESDVESQVATAIYVSVLGLVVFATAKFTVDESTDLTIESLSELIANPDSVYRKKILYAAPFACTGFRNPSHMTMSFLQGTENLVFQWDSASDALDPVSFQAHVSYIPSTTTPTGTDGQVAFQYALTPGAWPCSPWLAGTSLTSSPKAVTLELIRVDSMPTPGDLIYFGTASYDNTLYTPRFKTSPHVGGTYYVTAVCPARRTAGLDVRGTVVGILSSGDCFYVAATYTWPEFDSPIRIADVNARAVGRFGVDDTALSTVLAIIAPRATEAVPLPVTVRVTQVVQTAGASIADDALLALLQSATVFGTSSGSTATLVNTSTVRFDVQYADNAVYNSLFMTLPAVANGYNTYIENNFTTVSIAIAVPLPDAGVLAADEYLLFIVQLASTNSTSFDTQFSFTETDNTCIIIYGNSSPDIGYHYVFRNGYGGFKRLDIPTEIVPTAGGVLQVSTELRYAPDVIQRVNALVIGRPPRSGNAPVNDPIPALSAVLVSGTVAVNAKNTKTAPMASVTTADTTRQYVVTTQQGVQRPLP